ncbi:PAS domain S-box-containing protein [Halopenitus malekzadehii]|uniref:histidine kinase n=1 Tax=Halopenitus malekzadehii TaxID=1267564 RepID=A0A1H6IAU0_9EURY|nr:PAS domain-containing sensor histidine kinase [Halopenitus malekzadehii]SEH43967.1 PAS domain S-box-containing protein [Halopenitus malekzadehii]
MGRNTGSDTDGNADADDAMPADATALPVDEGEFYRTLVENAAEGMLTIDADSRIVYANPAIEDILGYTPEELVGSSKMRIIPERLRPVHGAALASYVETGERNIDWDGVELPALHKDGHEVPTLISLREHRHDGDQYFTGIVRDITDRKRRERELRRRKDRLDEFADVLAHDIRNPLSVAQGYTELAREDHDAPELDRVADSLGRIEELIDDLLALSKEGALIGETAPVDLADCVRESWDGVDTGDAELRIETPLGTIDADRSRLRDLLENLLRNSVEHSSTSPRSNARGNSVEHSGAPVTITVGLLSGSEATGETPHESADRTPDGFYLADDGPGIPDSIREEIFDRGYSTRDGGTGYGLAIVRGIAEAHGWTVSLAPHEKPESGTGARFEFRNVEFVSVDASPKR